MHRRDGAVSPHGARLTPSGFCDLHTHSTCSDGTVPPAEVARRACDARLDAFALTDHDTFDGIAEAADAAARLGIRFVPGIEMSLPHEATFHLIGLGVDPAHPAIRRVADALNEGRGPRNAEIVERLRAEGIDISLAEVEREAGGDVVARPHFASVLVKKGCVAHPQDAFDRWLAKGRPAYVERWRPTLADAVAAVRAAGGATVICHPHTLGFRDDEPLLGFLAGCRAAGVDAIEVRTGRTTEADERRWQAVADRAGLLPGGGSDFHGEAKADLRVGSGRGRMRVPTAWLDALLAVAAARRTG